VIQESQRVNGLATQLNSTASATGACLLRATLDFRLPFFLCLLILPLLVSCVTPGVVIPGDDYPYGILRAAIVSTMPRNVRQTSPNGREFDSNYFDANGNFDRDASAKIERAYAHVLLLGDRRPYKISVRVFIEKRPKDSLQYSPAGEDPGLAQELADKITQNIANRREDRNAIDDFRAF
jgi:hypothetical protein